MVTDARRLPVTLANRYRLQEVVGRGGMGEVWSATDLRLDRPVAVKLLNAQMASEPSVRDRFEVEARSAARLTHPNVVLVYDSGEEDGTPFLVMELLPGRTLADELVLGSLDADRARRIGVEVLSALAASHQAGILHRDIKPGNVLLTTNGTAKVGDFGIAKSTEGLHLTSTGMIVGTAAYLAPERVTGQSASPQSDIYAVGVVLYEALSGRKPFDADTPIGMMRAVEAHEVVPLSEICPGLDPGLVAAIDRAMAKDPGQRFVSATEMAAALQATHDAPTRGDQTVLDSPAVGATQMLPGPSSTQVLSSPGPSPTEVDRPSANHQSASRALLWRGRPGVIAAVAVAALFVLVVIIGTRGGSNAGSPTANTPTTAAASPVSVPPALDQAIKNLEQAVRP
ncbi:MAG: serine/threonine protein kinase [Actinomycetota bacterium]|nr:serine/threonine protein kinase [Actinomycetota bacterium]